MAEVLTFQNSKLGLSIQGTGAVADQTQAYGGLIERMRSGEGCSSCSSDILVLIVLFRGLPYMCL